MWFRIVGGAASGCRIAIPPVADVKPPPERVRESLFSLLNDHRRVRDHVVLDLFAGSAVMGLEAVSRGARFCTFVEKNRRALAVIRKNVQAVGLSRRCAVCAGDLLAPQPPRLALKENASLVFFDPPFACFADRHSRDRLEHLLHLIGSTYAACDAWFVIRHENRHCNEAAELVEQVGLTPVVEKVYGRSVVKIVSNASPPDE